MCYTGLRHAWHCCCVLLFNSICWPLWEAAPVSLPVQHLLFISADLRKSACCGLLLPDTATFGTAVTVLASRSAKRSSNPCAPAVCQPLLSQRAAAALLLQDLSSSVTQPGRLCLDCPVRPLVPCLFEANDCFSECSTHALRFLDIEARLAA